MTPMNIDILDSVYEHSSCMMNLDGVRKHEAPPTNFVIPGLVRRSIGALIAPGGTGKSFYAIQIGIACAVGGMAPNMLPFASGAGQQVLYVNAEDPVEILWGRIRSVMVNHYNSFAQDLIVKNLSVSACCGRGANISDKGWFDYFVNTGYGKSLIIIDTLSRIHRFDENSNSQMAELLCTFDQLAHQTGAAVVYLHHISKTTALSGLGDLQQAARGASSIIDNARWCSFLAGMSESEASNFGIADNDRSYFARVGVCKNNYSAPIADSWYRRKSGILIPIELSKKETISSVNGFRRKQA